MSARRHRLLLVALAALLAAPTTAMAGAAAAGVGHASRPAAGSAGACADPSGVTVVVDFSAFGGGVDVRCAGWPVSSGFDALRKAGFTITDTSRYPGFLCRIDGLPGDQACVNPPPRDAYWGYWYAARGGSWTYSTQGGGSRSVSEGGVEGWAFGAGARPSVAPPAPPPPATTAPPPTSPAPPTPPDHGAPAPSAGSPQPPSPAPAGAEAVAPEAPAEEAAAPTSEAVEGAAAEGDRLRSASAPGAEASRMAASRPSAGGTGSGTPLPAVLTAVVLGVLAVGGTVARRRRRAVS